MANQARSAVFIDGLAFDSPESARTILLGRCRNERERIIWVQKPTPKEVDVAFGALCAVLEFNRQYPQLAISESECRDSGALRAPPKSKGAVGGH